MQSISAKHHIIFGLLFIILFSFPLLTAHAQVGAQVLDPYFTKTLQLGSTEDQVTGLQEFLKKFPDIYPEGVISGSFGAFTENAVKRFQTQQGIAVTGIVDIATRARLNALVATSSVPQLPNTGTVSTAPISNPSFPNTGSLPGDNGFVLNVVIVAGVSILALILLMVVLRKRKT